MRHCKSLRDVWPDTQEEKWEFSIQSSSLELKEEQVWSSMIREDTVFKMIENAQPASGDQEAAAGGKGKEN